MKFEYTPIKDKQVKRKLIKKWAVGKSAEDIPQNMGGWLELDFHFITLNKNVIGWLALGDPSKSPLGNMLTLVFINETHRGKGLLTEIIRAARIDFKCELLLLGECVNEYDKFTALYKAAGFMECYQIISMSTGQVYGEVMAINRTVGLYPMDEFILVSREELKEVTGIDYNSTTPVSMMEIMNTKMHIRKELCLT